MKKLTTLLLFGFCAFSNAQQKINFSYDSAGNQIVRSLCISGCNPAGKSVDEVKEVQALTDEDLLKFSKQDVISYYPNPVKEQLYLKWELINDNKVSSNSDRCHFLGIIGNEMLTKFSFLEHLLF